MSIEGQLEGLERDERALEKIALAFDRLASIAEKFYAKLYPEPKSVRPATLTKLTSEADKDLAETIQGTEPTLEQWKEIGPREREFLKKQGAKS